MSLSPVLSLVAIAAIAVGAFGLTKGRKPAAPARAAAERYTPQVLAAVNQARASEAKSPLASDPALEAWLQEQLAGLTPEAVGKMEADELLKRLGNSLPGIRSLGAGVFFGRDEAEVLREITEWRETDTLERTHLAASAISVAGHAETVACVALAVTRAPRFSPKLLGSGVTDFHHACARCGHEYLSRFLGDQISLAIRCPSCQEVHGLVAFGSGGQFRDVRDYLLGLNPPAKFPANLSRQEELRMIWQTVVNHCTYTSDGPSRIAGTPDAWQDARETFARGKGDCEDTSILLADWLISRGFEARVVMGESKSLAGHAWCVARLDGVEYLLETTDGSRVHQPPPRAEELATEYKPEYQFDRQALYVLKTAGIRTCAYWTDLMWTKVEAREKSQPSPADDRLATAWEAAP